MSGYVVIVDMPTNHDRKAAIGSGSTKHADRLLGFSDRHRRVPAALAASVAADPAMRSLVLILTIIAAAPTAANAQTTAPPNAQRRLRRPRRAHVSNCTRKRTNATPVCVAAISASSAGRRRGVSVMRNGYRRYWYRTTADGRKNVEFIKTDTKAASGVLNPKPIRGSRAI